MFVTFDTYSTTDLHMHLCWCLFSQTTFAGTYFHWLLFSPDPGFTIGSFV